MKRTKLIGIAAGLVLAVAVVSPAIAGLGGHDARPERDHAARHASDVVPDVQASQTPSTLDNTDANENEIENHAAGSQDIQGEDRHGADDAAEVENEQEDVNDTDADSVEHEGEHVTSESTEPSESPEPSETVSSSGSDGSGTDSGSGGSGSDSGSDGSHSGDATPSPDSGSHD